MKRQLLAVCLLCLCGTLFAQSWQMVGSRAMGMGGAGVAVSTGAEAQYWNPAGLVVLDEQEKDFILGFGAQMETTKNVMDSLDGLKDMSDKYKTLSNKIKAGGTPDASDLTTLFQGVGDIANLTKEGTGVLAGADAGFGFKIKNFGVSVRSLGTMGITPTVDQVNVGFSTQGGGAGLNLSGSTSAPVDTTEQQAANIIADVINSTGTFDALKALLGGTYTNATELANKLVNTASGAGSTPAQILEAAQKAAEYLPSAADLVKNAGSASGGNGYENNTSRVMADVAAFSEASLGYGHEVINGVQIGANLKVIEGTLAQTGILVLQDKDEIKDIAKDAWDHKRNTTQLGIDLGARLNFARLLDKEIWGKPTIGMTVRNINSPKFKRPNMPANIDPRLVDGWDTSDYKLKPQVRAGGALELFNRLTVAADLDLTENDTSVKGYQSRQLAFGGEIDLTKGKGFGVPLRVGINKNLAESQSETYYTAGIGLRIVHFWLELAGAISNDTVEVDNKDIPAAAAASLQFGFTF